MPCWASRYRTPGTLKKGNMLAPLHVSGAFRFLLCLNGSVQKEIRCAPLCGKSFYQRIYGHLKEYLLKHMLHSCPLSFHPKRTATSPPHPPPCCLSLSGWKQRPLNWPWKEAAPVFNSATNRRVWTCLQKPLTPQRLRCHYRWSPQFPF